MASNQTSRGNQVQITAEERSTVSGSKLTDNIGLTRSEIQWRKQFTQFDDADVRRLTGMQEFVSDNKELVVDDFYDHLEGFDETVEIFGRSSKTVDQLKQSQQQYLVDLVSGNYDKTYFENRARIGKIHDMLNLGPKIYFGAYSVYFEHFLDGIKESLRAGDDDSDDKLDQFAERALSVFKLINLDQQVAMDTYIDSYNERLEGAIEEQEALMADVEEGLKEPVEDLTETAQSVDETSQALSENADEQANAMSEVAGEVGDMSATIEEIASTAEEVASTSTTAEDLAEEGQDAAEGAVERMEEVDTAVSEASSNIDGLQSKADEIGDIVDIIDKIADQTNILALNASIEAARAGESGDGFAVVADEIKSLAGDSQEHANRIERTINEMQSETDDAVEGLRTVTEQVDEGVEEVQRAMQKLESIVSAINESAQGITEVSSATDDQAASTEEVASMVDEATKSLDDMANEIESLARANERQTQKIEAIADTARQLDTTEQTGGNGGPQNLGPNDF